MSDPGEAPKRPLARVSAPTDRGRLVARGSAESPANRFERLAYAEDPDFVDDAPDDVDGARTNPLRTRYYRDPSRTLLARNESPDIGFDVSINPYRGCEHGCSTVHHLTRQCSARTWSGDRSENFESETNSIAFDEFPRPTVIAQEASSRACRRHLVVTESHETAHHAQHRGGDNRRAPLASGSRFSLVAYGSARSRRLCVTCQSSGMSTSTTITASGTSLE